MWRLLFAGVALTLSLLLVTDAVDAGKKKKAGKINGVILNVQPAGAKGEATLTVQTNPKKKKGGAAEEGKELKIRVNGDTKIEKAGQKKGDPKTPATLADLHAKQRVTITLCDGEADVAEHVLIAAGKKKKNAQ